MDNFAPVLLLIYEKVSCAVLDDLRHTLRWSHSTWKMHAHVCPVSHALNSSFKPIRFLHHASIYSLITLTMSRSTIGIFKLWWHVPRSFTLTLIPGQSSYGRMGSFGNWAWCHWLALYALQGRVWQLIPIWSLCWESGESRVVLCWSTSSDSASGPVHLMASCTSPCTILVLFIWN